MFGLFKNRAEADLAAGPSVGAQAAVRLGYYVYALVDPRAPGDDPSRIFYIGKGKGDRCFQHAANVLRAKGESPKDLKSKRIARIVEATGTQPEVLIVAHGLEEAAAFQLEALLISVFDGLTNQVSGQGDSDYWIPADVLLERYDQAVPRDEIDGNVLFVSLNGRPPDVPAYPDLLEEREIMRRTLGDWVIAENKARQVDHVVGVYRQLVRRVYTVDQKAPYESCVKTIAPRSRNAMPRRRWIRAKRNRRLEEALSMRAVMDAEGVLLTKFNRQQASYFSPQPEADRRPRRARSTDRRSR